MAKDAHTVNSKVWAVPGGKYTVGIAYHIPIFEKAGIKDEPKTWADMTDAFDFTQTPRSFSDFQY